MEFKPMGSKTDSVKSTVTYYPYANNNDFKFTLIISSKAIVTSKTQQYINRKVLGLEATQKFKNLLSALNVFTPRKLNESYDILPVMSQKMTIKSKGLFFSITWTNADELNYESHLRTVIELANALQLEFSPEGLQVLKADPPGVIRPVYL